MTEVNYTVKAQKMVPLPSVVQSEFYEAMRILFVRKENKNNDIHSTIVTFLSLCVSIAPFWRASDLIQNILNCVHRTNEAFTSLEQSD